ncbi:hypothetical protein Golob_012593 [Gossypium lobatum]|uniref:Uncharacterized protein n=1 Tax=Gossypium lobatum TaxID=34289 RepID=A0A7J8LLV8_9ROSI|nr:hypothetical protein [Gossypium lobatum]
MDSAMARFWKLTVDPRTTISASATSPPKASSIGRFALVSSHGPSSAATCGGPAAKSTLMSFGSITSSSTTQRE